jgi:predicted transcriptional regulator
MATEIIKITSQIVISHASMTELSTQELVEEIKSVYNLLASLEGGAVIPEIMAPKKAEEAGVVKKKPPIPLKDIVQEKFVICLECKRKMKSLKVHLQKAHGLTDKEYFWKYDLDPKHYPLVAREYSKQRSQMALSRGFGKEGGRRKKARA